MAFHLSDREQHQTAKEVKFHVCAWKKEKAEALAQSKLSDKKSARKGMISDCNPFNPRLEGATRLLALLISSLASNLRNSRKKEKKKRRKKGSGG